MLPVYSVTATRGEGIAGNDGDTHGLGALPHAGPGDHRTQAGRHLHVNVVEAKVLDVAGVEGKAQILGSGLSFCMGCKGRRVIH